MLAIGSWVIALSMIAAQWILGSTRKSWAWLLVAFVQLEYIAFGALTNQWGFVAGALVFIVVNLRNYRKWRLEEQRHGEQGLTNMVLPYDVGQPCPHHGRTHVARPGDRAG